MTFTISGPDFLALARNREIKSKGPAQHIRLIGHTGDPDKGLRCLHELREIQDLRQAQGAGCHLVVAFQGHWEGPLALTEYLFIYFYLFRGRERNIHIS